jgi:16S rRNA (cytidine1402-2'-O)-methyltransferase
MESSRNTKSGMLYIVATPIGNLEDITLRALRILKEVDLIAAEDTRHTKKLLNHFDIHTPLMSYYREKEQERGAVIVERLLAGENVALVSDAGTPAVSDPGAILVQMAHEADITVSPIPGPSALTAAVSGSGFTDGTFLFLGFAPNKKSQRRKLLSSLVHSEYPVVFYEAPRRIEGFLQDALEILGDRPAVWARELTKTYEELTKRTLSALLDHCGEHNSRGELVIIIGPATTAKAEGDNVEELLLWYRDHSGLSMKDACRQLAEDLGLSRSQIYQQALDIWKTKD